LQRVKRAVAITFAHFVSYCIEERLVLPFPGAGLQLDSDFKDIEPLDGSRPSAGGRTDIKDSSTDELPVFSRKKTIV
jgi:hypothetical protein